MGGFPTTFRPAGGATAVGQCQRSFPPSLCRHVNIHSFSQCSPFPTHATRTYVPERPTVLFLLSVLVSVLPEEVIPGQQPAVIGHPLSMNRQRLAVTVRFVGYRPFCRLTASSTRPLPRCGPSFNPEMDVQSPPPLLVFIKARPACQPPVSSPFGAQCTGPKSVLLGQDCCLVLDHGPQQGYPTIPSKPWGGLGVGPCEPKALLQSPAFFTV